MKKSNTIGRNVRDKATLFTTKARLLRKKTQTAFNARPLAFFYLSIAVLVGLIVLGNILREPAAEPKETTKAPLNVATYTLGGAPQVTVTGEIEKSGVVTIVALTQGVVQKRNYQEGDPVAKGAVLMNLASNYHGGNAMSTQRQLAGVQYQQVLDTYDAQKDLIEKQKESARKMDAQSGELREITEDSLSETRDLISLNSSIISKLNDNLEILEADPVTNADAILATKQAKSQFLAAQAQSKSALRQSEYQSDNENEPAELSQLQLDIAIKQLDLQAKMLDVQKEVSRLQLSLARITEGMTTPAAPFSGVVQRVFVKVGEVVNPGTPLAIVSQVEDDPITVVAYVSRDIAQKISTTEPALITIRDEKIEVIPHYVTADAIDTGLYAVYFALPDSYISKVTDKDHALVHLNLMSDDPQSTVPYIPLDSIHQTSTSAYVFVVEDGKAKAHNVELGSVFGSLVQVTGLSRQETIILDRTVTEGTEVTYGN